MKNSILEEVICYRIPIQTLSFLTALPTRQDGAENRDKAAVWTFESVFEKFLLRDALRVWTVGLTAELKLNFLISPA